MINKKRTRRLWREEGLRRPAPCKRKRTRPPGGGTRLRAKYPNHVYLRLAETRTFGNGVVLLRYQRPEAQDREIRYAQAL